MSLSTADTQADILVAGAGAAGLSTAIALPGVECAAACDLYDGRHELAKEIVGKPIPTTRRYQA